MRSHSNIAYLLKYDTVYGRYEKAVTETQGHLTIGSTD
jgi:glyceraldehyde-3-phosphate dehydrogenase/erythrose-4-phosphate dehydrogenase